MYGNPCLVHAFRGNAFSFSLLSMLAVGCSCMHACMLSCLGQVWLFAMLRTIVHQAPLSMGFSRHECWSWLAMPSSRESSWPSDWTSVSSVSGIDKLVHWSSVQFSSVQSLSRVRLFVTSINSLYHHYYGLVFSDCIFLPNFQSWTSCMFSVICLVISSSLSNLLAYDY